MKRPLTRLKKFENRTATINKVGAVHAFGNNRGPCGVSSTA